MLLRKNKWLNFSKQAVDEYRLDFPANRLTPIELSGIISHSHFDDNSKSTAAANTILAFPP